MGEKGIVLQSASFEPGGDEARQLHLEQALEKGGYEPAEAPPEPEAEENESLTQEQRLNKNLKNYGAQIERAKAKYEDWDELKAQFDKQDVFIGHGVQVTILEQPNGADVTHYLMRHPAFAKKLGEMSRTPGREISAIREVERLSARLWANTPHREAPPRRPIRPRADASSAEIAAMPRYRNQYRDFKRAQRERR